MSVEAQKRSSEPDIQECMPNYSIPGKCVVWLVAQGQNHVDIASAYLKDGELDAAAEACRKADEYSGEAQHVPLHELDSTVRQTLRVLNIDIEITKARIRCGAVARKAVASVTMSAAAAVSGR